MKKPDIQRDLDLLLSRDPASWRRSLRRLADEDPERFAEFVEATRRKLAAANEAEDRPVTPDEVETLTVQLQEELGWNRTRVHAEGLLRLQEVVRCIGFRPLTPEERRRPDKYLRRLSSVHALVLGPEFRAALAGRVIDPEVDRQEVERAATVRARRRRA